MIILLYGADRQRLMQKKKEIYEVYVTRNAQALDFKKFDLSRKEDFVLLEDFIKTQSMFTSKKLAQVDYCFAREKELLDLIQLMSLPTDVTRTLLLSHYSELPKSALAEYLQEIGHARVQRFQLGTKAQASALLQEQLGRAGITVELKLFDLFVGYYGNDPSKFEKAVERLVLWKQANNETRVTEDDLVYFIPETEESIFACAEAFLRKDITEFHRIMGTTAYTKQHAGELLRILDYELKQLVIILSGDKQKIQTLAFWVRRKLEDIARTFSQEELVMWYKKIASLDARLKRSEVTEGEAIEELLYTPLLFV
ncbi:MAG: hypothetical protein HZA35_02290 [Parcubacteria group bacterium]|nr:hypothetical protein [Parcubacteria group bacterium]